MTATPAFTAANINRQKDQTIRRLRIDWQTGDISFGDQFAQLRPNEARILDCIANPIRHDMHHLNEADLSNYLGYRDLEEFRQSYTAALLKIDEIVLANYAGDGGHIFENEKGKKIAMPRFYDFTVKAHHLFFVTDNRCHGFRYDLYESVSASNEVSDEKMAACKPPLEPRYF